MRGRLALLLVAIAVLAGAAAPAGAAGTALALYANPDPDGVYGSSFPDQVDRLLSATKPDGVALDRSDRLDLDYGSAYDFGGSDGYASRAMTGQPAGEAASITYEGKRQLLALRRIVDAHRATLISNLRITPLFDRLSDAKLIDQPMTPWKLLFMRATANGKPSWILDTTPDDGIGGQKGCDDVYPARLTQSQAWQTGGMFSSAVCPLGEPAENSRLQYVVPTGDGYPSLWLLSNGTGHLSFHPSQSSIEDEFAGSEFAPPLRKGRA